VKFQYIKFIFDYVVINIFKQKFVNSGFIEAPYNERCAFKPAGYSQGDLIVPVANHDKMFHCIKGAKPASRQSCFNGYDDIVMGIFNF